MAEKPKSLSDIDEIVFEKIGVDKDIFFHIRKNLESIKLNDSHLIEIIEDYIFAEDKNRISGLLSYINSSKEWKDLILQKTKEYNNLLEENIKQKNVTEQSSKEILFSLQISERFDETRIRETDLSSLQDFKNRLHNEPLLKVIKMKLTTDKINSQVRSEAEFIGQLYKCNLTSSEIENIRTFEQFDFGNHDIFSFYISSKKLSVYLGDKHVFNITLETDEQLEAALSILQNFKDPKRGLIDYSQLNNDNDLFNTEF